MTQTSIEQTAFTLFASGIKPAYISDESESGFQDLIEKYPYIYLNQRNVMFFKSEELKNNFVTRLDLVEPGSHEYHRIIGEMLGYPPQAVDFFTRCQEQPELRAKKAAFRYCGIYFVGNVEQALDICYWLWKNVRIPMTNVEVEHLGVKYIISPDKI
ncbi:hypothetical protein [Laceyella putida]|uniref:Uncharacterized protein n=1 Tax=Laceyella putida TaxID=110101 RepID=A0ABW2RK32_9BACL